MATTTKVLKKNTKGKTEKTVGTTRPPTADMVNAAIKTLKERGGSSLYAIKRYISTTYMVDAEKLAPFIKKYIKNAVINGTLIQAKGQGASGSFKLPSSSKKRAVAPAAASTASSSAKPKVTAKSVEKTAAVPKKKSSTKKVAATTITKTKVTVLKSPLNIKTTKVPAKKTKAAKSPMKKPTKAVAEKSQAKKGAKKN